MIYAALLILSVMVLFLIFDVRESKAAIEYLNHAEEVAERYFSKRLIKLEEETTKHDRYHKLATDKLRKRAHDLECRLGDIEVRLNELPKPLRDSLLETIDKLLE